MRRLARHVFTILAVLSLLLCLATCALWIRSYRVLDSVISAAPHTWAVESNSEEASLSVTDLTGRPANLSTTRGLKYGATAPYRRTRSRLAEAEKALKGKGRVPQLTQYLIEQDRVNRLAGVRASCLLTSPSEM